MSNFEPRLPAPPPPPSSPPPPPSWQQSMPPQGYVAYGQAPAVLPEPKGLRTATLVLFGCVSGFCLILGLVAYQRGGVLADYFDGSKRLQDVKDSDSRVQSFAVLLIVFEIAVAVVLAIWSHHTTKNALTRQPNLGVKPGLAAGGWFIPFGNYFVPWKQLHRASSIGGTPSSLKLWQSLFLGQAIVNIIARNVGNIDNLSNASRSSVVDRLHNQGMLFLATGVMLVAATAAAAKAMPAIDRATSGTA